MVNFHNVGTTFQNQNIQNHENRFGWNKGTNNKHKIDWNQLFNTKINDEVQEEQVFIKENTDKIKTTSEGRYLLDAETAETLFKTSQFDNGEEGKFGNGSDFSVKVIEKQIEQIQAKIAELTTQSTTEPNVVAAPESTETAEVPPVPTEAQTTNTQAELQNYKIQLGFLNGVLSANTDNNNKVTLEEFQSSIVDGNFSFAA